MDEDDVCLDASRSRSSTSIPSTPDSTATRALHTYLADDTSLEVATLETRQKQSSGVTRSGSSCASEESDSVETHGGFE
jgi:hypothetical protein